MAKKNIFKEIFKDNDEDVLVTEDNLGEQFYRTTAEEATPNGESNMIIFEPRAFSEATQVVDYLRKRNTVVLNLKRITKDQAKRVADFVSGAVYAIDGNMQNIGGGNFLCTPKNVNVEGKLSDDKDSKAPSKDEIDIEW